MEPRLSAVGSFGRRSARSGRVADASAPLLIGAASAITLYATLFSTREAGLVLHGEDRAIEYLGAAALLVASVAFFLCFRRTRSSRDHTAFYRVVVALMSAAFLFGAGEEISWGQRLLGIDTPDAIAQVNVQGELTFHNLSTWGGALNFESAFQLFWFGFGVVIPVVCGISARTHERLSRWMPILPVWLSALFVIQQILGEGAQLFLEAHPHLYHGEAAVSGARFEITETAISALLAVGALISLRELTDRRVARRDRLRGYRSHAPAA